MASPAQRAKRRKRKARKTKRRRRIPLRRRKMEPRRMKKWRYSTDREHRLLSENPEPLRAAFLNRRDASRYRDLETFLPGLETFETLKHIPISP